MASVSQIRSRPNTSSARTRGRTRRQTLGNGNTGLDGEADLPGVPRFAGGDGALNAIEILPGKRRWTHRDR